MGQIGLSVWHLCPQGRYAAPSAGRCGPARLSRDRSQRLAEPSTAVKQGGIDAHQREMQITPLNTMMRAVLAAELWRLRRLRLQPLRLSSRLQPLWLQPLRRRNRHLLFSVSQSQLRAAQGPRRRAVEDGQIGGLDPRRHRHCHRQSPARDGREIRQRVLAGMAIVLPGV